MDGLAREALDTAVSRGAGYADSRLLETIREDLVVKDGQLCGLDQSESRGIGVRVLVDGAWGYAATDDLTREGVQACAAHAVAVGKASARVLEGPVRLASEPSHRAGWASSSAGEFDVVLEGSQLALQIHESVGHPTELDRVLGLEANYAGTSFLTLDTLGTLRFGSPKVNLVADATLPHGLATFAFDDEGVEAQRWPIVRDGLFVGYLTSRELAHRVGEPRSRGCVRSDGWNHIPMIRMVNLSLMPGAGSLDDLLADTGHGLYMETNRSWSIDQLRYNFQFKTEIAWEIKKGKRVRMLRNPTYQGITTQFWNSCDFVCGQEAWKPWGVTNCGKGQPGQVAEITHGASPARFRKVLVGAGYDA